MFTPTVGEEVFIRALSPFDKLSLNDSYIITSITLIPDYAGSDIDIFNDVYNVVGLTRADMEDDIRNRVPIISLGDISGGTSSTPIPLNRLDFLDASIPYNKHGIGINLGNLPSDIYLDALIEDIKTLIEDRLGIVPKTTIAKLSSKVPISINDHDNFLEERKAHQNSVKSFRLENLELKSKVSTLENTVLKLKTCVKNK